MNCHHLTRFVAIQFAMTVVFRCLLLFTLRLWCKIGPIKSVLFCSLDCLWVSFEGVGLPVWSSFHPSSTALAEEATRVMKTFPLYDRDQHCEGSQAWRAWKKTHDHLQNLTDFFTWETLEYTTVDETKTASFLSFLSYRASTHTTHQTPRWRSVVQSKYKTRQYKFQDTF